MKSVMPLKHVKVGLSYGDVDNDKIHVKEDKNIVKEDKNIVKEEIYKFMVPNITIYDLRDIDELLPTTSSLDEDILKEISYDKEILDEKSPVGRIIKRAEDRNKKSPVDKSFNPTKSRSNSQNYCKLGTTLDLNGESILLLRFGNEVITCDQRCPHKGRNLVMGDIESMNYGDRIIKCPSHNFKFNLDDNGAKCSHESYPMCLRLKIYPTSVDPNTGEITVEFPNFHLII